MFEHSILFIRVHVTKYSSLKPWQLENQYNGSGTCFCVLIDGSRYFVTNSHVINGARHIEIKRYNDAEFVPATLLLDNPYVDLALLKCDIDAEPLVVDYNIPNIKEDVFLYGFPLGYENISVTKGVVNRIIMQTLLDTAVVAIQVDAASYFGNSGGPLVHKNKVVGILNYGVMASGLNFCIPSYFLRYMHTLYTEKKSVGLIDKQFRIQHMNHILARRLKFKEKGVFVTEIDKGCGTIKVGDILRSIDGVPVDNDGTVLLSSFICVPRELDFPVSIDHYVGVFTSNKSIRCSVWRNGKTVDAIIKVQYKQPNVKTDNTRFVAVERTTVFVPMSIAGIIEMRKKGLNMGLVNAGFLPNSENIILVELMEQKNISYVRTPLIVKAVNGKEPESFDDFIALMKQPELDITFHKWHEHLYIDTPHIMYN